MESLEGLLLVLFVSLGAVVHGSPGLEDVYTPEEREALERFKPLVIPRIPDSSQLQKYVNDDLFFVQWLRSMDLDVRGAERLFLQHLRWRETMKVDAILNEDWTQFQRDIPAFNDGFDKQGRPLVEAWVSDWQIRALIVDGKMKSMNRWTATFLETLSRRLFEGRAAGKMNISQATAIVEAEEFNLVDQGCPRCLIWIATVASTLDNHYPNLLDSVYIINIRPAFGVVLGVVLPIMRPETRKALKYYRNRSVWMPILDGVVDKEQRGVIVGGTKVRDLHNGTNNWRNY